MRKSNGSSKPGIGKPKGWVFGLRFLCLILLGCETMPDTTPSARQQAEADLVVGFQSWNAIWFIRPDVTGTAGSMTLRRKMFTGDGFVKLLRNLKVGRDFVVVVLDRQYSPDPVSARGGMDAIQGFFKELGFRRTVIQDGAGGGSGEQGLPVLRDSAG
jgi:hypothetical protein